MIWLMVAMVWLVIPLAMYVLVHTEDTIVDEFVVEEDVEAIYKPKLAALMNMPDPFTDEV